MTATGVGTCCTVIYWSTLCAITSETSVAVTATVARGGEHACCINRAASICASLVNARIDGFALFAIATETLHTVTIICTRCLELTSCFSVAIMCLVRAMINGLTGSFSRL